jgi:hypothetical protein
MVTIYRFTVYDITTDENRLSRRMGTRQAVGRANGEVIEDTAREVEAPELGREVPGMTDRDYWLRSDVSGGFQRAVMR